MDQPADTPPLCAAEPAEATAPDAGADRVHPDSPLIVSYGGGVDSTALLVGLARLHRRGGRGWRPDLIVFADTGSERPETYEAILAVDRWVRQVWPGLAVTVVRVETERAPYTTIEGNCLANDTLPSFAFGGHSCSIKWKQEPIDKHVAALVEGAVASALRDGVRVVRAIGYDDSSADRCRFAKAAKATEKAGDQRWAFWYPLQDWGWDRARCQDEIAAEDALAALLVDAIGQPYPIKSSCWFCPAARLEELRDLAQTHPDLALRAAVMEHRAATGKHGLGAVNGLGLTRPGTPKAPKGTRNYSWSSWWVDQGLLPGDWLAVARERGLLPESWEGYSAEARPARERVAAARDAEAEATAALPARWREALKVQYRKKDGRARYGVKTKARRAVEAEIRSIIEVAGPGEGELAWLAAVAEREAAERALKAFRAPDWIDTKQEDPEHWPRLLPLARR